jgi:hypothetical protein
MQPITGSKSLSIIPDFFSRDYNRLEFMPPSPQIALIPSPQESRALGHGQCYDWFYPHILLFSSTCTSQLTTIINHSKTLAYID